jgi:hypothetical protein
MRSAWVPVCSTGYRRRDSRWPGVNGGGEPREKERFVKARAEFYWTIREELEAGEVDLTTSTRSSPS